MNPHKTETSKLGNRGELSLPLETERLLIRKFAESDAARLQVLLDDRELASHSRSINYPLPSGEGERLIAQFNKAWNTGDAYAFAIQLKPVGESGENSQVIGGVGVEVDKSNHRAELGYWVGREYWNHGFCTEAAKCIVDFGFETLGLQKVTAHHVARNPASGRVLEKIGMTEEGRLRRHVRKWGVFEDVVVYGILSCDPRPN